MATELASRRCINCWHSKGLGSKEVPAVRGQSCLPACRKLDGAATWLLNSVVSVFFSSLEMCSCINIDTKDDYDDSKCLPLISKDYDHIDNREVRKYI